MDDKYKLVCLDSSVFIAKLRGEICNGIKRAVLFDQIWRKAGEGKLKVCISALTLAEVFKPKFQMCAEDVRLAEPHCEEFLNLIEVDFLDVIEIDRDTALLAHSLCRKLIVAPNDGMQLACAIQAGCDALIAWDRPLVGKKHDGISIEVPSMYCPDMYEETAVATEDEIKEYERLNPRKLKATKSAKPTLKATNGKSAKSAARPKVNSPSKTERPDA